jgi:hypothetical protein
MLQAPVRRGSIVLLAVLFGLVGSAGLIRLWHLVGFASRAKSMGYPLSEYITQCFGVGFTVGYLLLGACLGGFTRRPVGTAIGTMLPLPIAALIEVLEDPTSHNLLGFEIVIYWVPAFLVGLIAATAGRIARKRS